MPVPSLLRLFVQRWQKIVLPEPISVLPYRFFASFIWADNTTMHLCQTCEAMQPNLHYTLDTGIIPLDTYIVHQKTYSDIKTSSLRGCYVCGWLRFELIPLEVHHEEQIQRNPMTYCIAKTYAKDPKDEMRSASVELYRKKQGPSGEVMIPLSSFPLSSLVFKYVIDSHSILAPIWANVSWKRYIEKPIRSCAGSIQLSTTDRTSPAMAELLRVRSCHVSKRLRAWVVSYEIAGDHRRENTRQIDTHQPAQHVGRVRELESLLGQEADHTFTAGKLRNVRGCDPFRISPENIARRNNHMQSLRLEISLDRFTLHRNGSGFSVQL
jgi:hypothetical protein